MDWISIHWKDDNGWIGLDFIFNGWIGSDFLNEV
jgi:hypothetical protein